MDNRQNRLKTEELWILTGGKKPEKWLKESCLLTGRTNTVRLFSLSVQERTTPPQLPELRTPSSILEVRRGTGREKKDAEEGEQRWQQVAGRGTKERIVCVEKEKRRKKSTKLIFGKII